MTKFNPNYVTYKIPKILVCNSKCSNIIAYNLVKTIFYNLKNINNLIKINPNNLLFLPNIANNGFIPLHKGAITFYKEKSIIKTIDSKYCKYLIGKTECTVKEVSKIKQII